MNVFENYVGRQLTCLCVKRKYKRKTLIAVIMPLIVPNVNGLPGSVSNRG